MSPAGVLRRIRDVSGPQLYRDNLFRITGLPTDADAATVARMRQRVAAQGAFGGGATIDSGGELPLPRPVPVDDVLRALDDVSDPARRIVDELVWFWGPDGPCGCPQGLHADHDAAVSAHARALDGELDGKATGKGNGKGSAGKWSAAAAKWNAVLRRAAFWDHVRHRLAVLDDPRLDDAVVDALRDALPEALIAPLVDLVMATPDPVRLRGHVATWSLPGADGRALLADAAAPLFEGAAKAVADAREQLDARKWSAAATGLVDDAVPLVDRISVLLPPGEHRPTAAIRESVAILLNNCAMAGMDTGSPAAKLRGWFDLAERLAVETDTRKVVVENRTALAATRTPTSPRLLERGTTDGRRLLNLAIQEMEAGNVDLAMTLLASARQQLTGTERQLARDLLQELERSSASRRGTPAPSSSSAAAVVRGRPTPPVAAHDVWRLARQILDPVRYDHLPDTGGVVPDWARQVRGCGDWRHVYVLLQVWWLVASATALKADIHRAITGVWVATDQGKRPYRGWGWGGAAVLGGGAVAQVWSWYGVWVAVAAAAAVVVLMLVAAFVIFTRGVRVIARHFPDFWPGVGEDMRTGRGEGVR